MLNEVQNSLRVKQLKREAARYYREYMRVTAPYDCGKFMAEYFHPEATTFRKLFNATMDKLAELDPDCPKERL